MEVSGAAMQCNATLGLQCNVMQHLACQWAHLIYQFNSSPRPPKNLQSGEDLKIFRKKKIKKKTVLRELIEF